MFHNFLETMVPLKTGMNLKENATYMKVNTYTTDNANTAGTSKIINLHWRIEKVDVMVNQSKDKSRNPFLSFFQPCSILKMKFQSAFHDI